jgi:hypothetical protein
MFKVAETLELNYITSKFIQDPDACTVIDIRFVEDPDAFAVIDIKFMHSQQLASNSYNS